MSFTHNLKRYTPTSFRFNLQKDCNQLFHLHFCTHLQQEGIPLKISLYPCTYVCKIYARASRYGNKHIKNTARFLIKLVSFNPLRLERKSAYQV